jgi:hypothetical protein
MVTIFGVNGLTRGTFLVRFSSIPSFDANRVFRLPGMRLDGRPRGDGVRVDLESEIGNSATYHC